MAYTLTFITCGQRFCIGYETEWLAQRARTRALANGATFAEVQR